MKYLILFFIAAPAFGAISPSTVKDSALKYHPTVLSALENLRASEEQVKGRRGAFDTKVTSDYRRQTKHDWNATLHRTQLEKPLRFANSKVYAGAEQQSSAQGIFAPFYNTGFPQSQYGNYNLIGAKFSLWKDLLIDPDRAALKNAKYNLKMAKAEKKLTEWDIGRLGQLAYWQWVTARKIKNVYEELLRNGETRNDYLNARSKRGDIAQIVVTENEQYVANRKGSLQAAKERLVRAEFDLSLFYRDANAQPIVPGTDETYEDYPAKLMALLENLDLNSDIEQLMAKRPDLRNLALNVSKSEVDLELAKQDLKPKIDVTTEYFQRTVEHPQGLPRDYLMVMAQVSVPIERNLGNGNIGAARARKMIAERQMSYGLQSYRNDVLALRQALHLRLEQVTQAEIEFTKSKELVASETYKFKSGGGNLYLVNLREEAQANAEASFHEARLAFMDAYLTYQAMINTAD